MNIPLNIDWQQILLHLFNFVILTGGLYFLLYGPVKKFMNKRLRYYKELDKQANKKIKETTKDKLDKVEKTKAEAMAKAKTLLINVKLKLFAIIGA